VKRGRVMTMKELEEEYLHNAKLHGDLNISNRIANKAAKELIKLNTYMSSNLEIARQMVDLIINSDNINAQIWIAGLAIDINYNKENAIKLLMSLTKNKNIGILAMNTRGVLVTRKIISINDRF